MKPGDLVKYSSKGRYGGVVRFIICGNCTACQSKLYEQCSSEQKIGAVVVWPKNPATGKAIVGIYAIKELEHDNSNSQIDWDRYHGYGIYRRKYKTELDMEQKPLERHEVDWDVYNGFKKGKVSKRT